MEPVSGAQDRLRAELLTGGLYESVSMADVQGYINRLRLATTERQPGVAHPHQHRALARVLHHLQRSAQDQAHRGEPAREFVPAIELAHHGGCAHGQMVERGEGGFHSFSGSGNKRSIAQPLSRAKSAMKSDSTSM